MTVQTELELDRPTEIPEVDAKPAWGVAVKRAAGKFSRDGCTDIAAMLTYYGLFSLFPAIAALVSLIGVFNVNPDTIIQILADLTGKQTSDPSFETPRSIIERFSSSRGAGFALVIGVLTALWSASGYVGGFSRAMNRIYDVTEGRPIWKLRPWLYLVTLVEMLMILVVVLAMALSGGVARSIGNQVGVGEQAVQVWDIVKWPFVAFIVVTIIGLLYWATPNVRKPKRMFFSWGALVAFVVWVLGTLAFALYVTLSAGATYQKTYGAFAAAVLFLFWLWLTNLALLFGAELDAELERTRQLKSGLPAENMVLLPVRDESGLESRAEKVEEAVDTAHELRLESGKAEEGEIELVGDTAGATTATATRRGTKTGASGVPALVTSDRTAKDGLGRPQPTATRDDEGRPSRGGSDDKGKRDRDGGAKTQGQAKQALTPAEQEEQIIRARGERREAALKEASHQRRVRERLEAQERKAAAARKKAEQKRQAERKKAQQAAQPSREERWDQVEQARSQYVPRTSPARDDVERQRAERRASFRAQQSEKAAAPPAPKPTKVPMPSPLRDEVEQQRYGRRTSHFEAHPPRKQEEVPLKFRRDRKSES
ncbi:YihY family inner membrane protein [Barrientosiimonas humi]|uniref:YihY family inner membrane protein n=2 Tax=Barrientosiimonas TaxID=1535207 RepID=A0A542X9S9_9MICO|nr:MULTISPECIES: YihY/virulence factor BrkB family protein [Barrientosiimonas]TQL32592.1 YihY family inner membrane protein [Barrientosiimonas humi]BDZ57370.1 hypothetical protein GCM10025872_10270 [Barrientosiimonas endolithica]CAG7572584.1 hypothetical protein BH39T_PBIAJDOK_01202 [Barrientosiimonas humi]